MKKKLLKTPGTKNTNPPDLFGTLQGLLSNFKGPYFIISLEILPLILLSCFIALPYLDFRSNYYPNGYEYILVTVTHYVWNLFPVCGTCVLWNGLLNGGMPAFAELHGAVLHPFVILTTLIWGVINGSKVIVFLCLIISGFSMWWFAKELGVGRLSRVWVSLFGVVGGHLLGRLESGNIVLVLSVTFASLLFPMVLRLNKKPTNRRVALLAVFMALAWLSGQGYIQLGLVFGWFPAFLWLLYEEGKVKQEKWIAFGKSLFISGMLCAILFLPAAHFFKYMDKMAMTDFRNLQPIRYLPLNLVIGDSGLLGQQYLGMDTFPYAHINFIGWTPIIFALIAGHFVLTQKNKRIYAAIYLSILFSMVISSQELYEYLDLYFPTVMKLRAMSVTSSLMVPPILAMAAWGLDRLLELEWPNITKTTGQIGKKTQSLSLKWVILLPILVFSFRNVIPFIKNYINVHLVDIPKEELAFFQIKDAQWVYAPPEWLPVLLNGNHKIIEGDRPWVWKDRERLYGYIGFLNSPGNDVVLISHEKDFDVVQRPEELYASVNTGNGIIKCRAVALGGVINVTCDTPVPGILTVHDYQYSGWYAWIDRQPKPLLDGDWLSVNAPAGRHIYIFNYRPWDAYAGALISLIGFGLVVWLWRKKDD
jgi:hypothetical protein